MIIECFCFAESAARLWATTSSQISVVSKKTENRAETFVCLWCSTVGERFTVLRTPLPRERTYSSFELGDAQDFVIFSHRPLRDLTTRTAHRLVFRTVPGNFVSLPRIRIMTYFPNRKHQSRTGFTLIELVVVISIIALLGSLIAPAIQSARRTARRMECLNNMRNVGVAILNTSSITRGDLPPLSGSMTITNAAGRGMLAIGWPITILPALDSTALLKNIRKDALVSTGVAAVATEATVWLPAFTCPDDLDSYRRPGGLSYVVNSGFISAEVWGVQETATFFHQPYLINWKRATIPPALATRSTDGTVQTGDPSPIDMKIALSSGVFWRIVGSDGYRPSIDYVTVGDGTTTTLMLTENLNAGLWTGASVSDIGFGIRIPLDPTSFFPASGTVSPNCGEFSQPLSLNTDFPCSTFATLSAASFINSSSAVSSSSTSTASSTSSTAETCGTGNTATASATSTIPRPSSQHTGGVNVIMVDGSGRFLSETVDVNVYARHVTSNGVIYEELSLNQASY